MLKLIKVAEEGKKVAMKVNDVRGKMKIIDQEKKVYDEILWNKMFSDFMSLRPYMGNIKLLRTNIHYMDGHIYAFYISNDGIVSFRSHKNSNDNTFDDTFFFSMTKEKPYKGQGSFPAKLDVLRNEILPIWKDVFEDIKTNLIEDIKKNNEKSEREVDYLNKSIDKLESLRESIKSVKLTEEDVSKLIKIYPEIIDTGIGMIETAQKDGFYKDEEINDAFVLKYITNEVNDGFITAPKHKKVIFE